MEVKKESAESTCPARSGGSCELKHDIRSKVAMTNNGRGDFMSEVFC
jgi:hypothetical protein